MMREIDELLEKYYSGTSTIEEEKKLRKLAKEEGIMPEQKMFEVLDELPDFREMADKALSAQTRKPVLLRIATLRRIAAAAIVVIVVMAGFVFIRQTPEPSQQSGELTLAEATEHTRQALMLFANAVDRSREEMTQIDMVLSKENSTDK